MKTLFFILLAMLFYVHFGYPLLLAAVSLFYRKPVVKRALELDCSLIVTAHNEEKCIEQKIKNCLELDYPKDKLQILVVLDGCSDRTEAVAGPYAASGIELLVNPERAGKAAAQAGAVRRARGRILIFTDANAMLNRQAIGNLVRNFADPSVGCVEGNLIYRSHDNASRGEGIYKKYENCLKDLETRIGSCAATEGSLFAVRREFYANAGAQTVEDLVIPLNVISQGKRVVHEKEAVSTEVFDASPAEQIRRRARVVNGNLSSLFSVRGALNPLKHGFYCLEFLSHKILRWMTPFFLAGLFWTNAFLLNQKGFAVFFIAQGLFYSLALAYVPFSKRTAPKIIFYPAYVPYFFVLSNLGVFLGIVTTFSGRRAVRWQPVRR